MGFKKLFNRTARIKALEKKLKVSTSKYEKARKIVEQRKHLRELKESKRALDRAGFEARHPSMVKAGRWISEQENTLAKKALRAAGRGIRKGIRKTRRRKGFKIGNGGLTL